VDQISPKAKAKERNGGKAAATRMIRSQTDYNPTRGAIGSRLKQRTHLIQRLSFTSSIRSYSTAREIETDYEEGKQEFLMSEWIPVAEEKR
jgi:hypothetical protein